MRLCFASPTHEEIREGIAALAEVCRREFGVPTRISNVTRASHARPQIGDNGLRALSQVTWRNAVDLRNPSLPSRWKPASRASTSFRPISARIFEAHNIPPGAVEKVTARKVYPVMAPADYQGRSAGAPVKGPRGLIVSIAECPPHNGPGLHRHLNTVENFFCLTGRFEISWGDNGEHKTVLEPNDMISIPRGENRMFFNISDEVGRLLVMIVPETDQQVDPILYAPSLGKEIEDEYGKQALEGLQTHRLQVRGAGGLTARPSSPQLNAPLKSCTNCLVVIGARPTMSRIGWVFSWENAPLPPARAIETRCATSQSGMLRDFIPASACSSVIST